MKFLTLPMFALLCAFSCTVDRFVDFPDITLPVPSKAELTSWQERFDAGTDRWRGDWGAVADRALRENLEVPWKYQEYDSRAYQIKNDRPDWGPYVIRGHAKGNLNKRYRVKVRKYGDIWYATVVSHYAQMTDLHPALQDGPDD